MLDYKDTEKAYAHISTMQLKRDRWMLKLMQYKSLVDIGSKFTLGAVHYGVPIDSILKNTLFKKFCGGETLEAAIANTQPMRESGMQICFHYAVEGLSSTEAADDVVNEKKNILQHTSGFAALKCTGLISPEIFQKKQEKIPLTVEEIARFEGFKNRMFILGDQALTSKCSLQIDAEESWIQDIIDGLAFEMMAKYNSQRPVIYQTAQMYRRDTLDKLRHWIDEADRQGFILAIKLVRGAYHELESQFARERGILNKVHTKKEDTDRDYNKALELLMTSKTRVAVFAGTHNEESVANYAKHMDRQFHPHATTSQLFGMADHLTFNCQAQGYPSCKYIPYGPVQKVIPYLIRRAMENTSIQGEMTRELQMIQQELDRRLHIHHEQAS